MGKVINMSMHMPLFCIFTNTICLSKYTEQKQIHK